MCLFLLKTLDGCAFLQPDFFFFSHILFHYCITPQIFENFVQNPTELLQRHHSDGTFYTHAPTDIWELLHHHLSLATSTSSPVLSFLVANAIVEELHVIIRKTTAYVTQMNTPDPEDGPPALYREIELELLCALSNDIALHFEQVQMVVEKFNIDEIRCSACSHSISTLTHTSSL